MLVLLFWTIATRVRASADTNWPLIFFGMLVMYHQSLPGRINDFALYVGVICALFLRFEFLSGFFRYLFMTIEIAVLLLISYDLMQHVVI